MAVLSKLKKDTRCYDEPVTITRNRFAVFTGSALLTTCLGWAVAAQQKPATRAASAAPGGIAVTVYKSPT
jgi:hypothetical protein